MHLSPYLTNILIKYVDTKIVKLKHAVLKVSISKAWIFIFFLYCLNQMTLEA